MVARLQLWPLLLVCCLLLTTSCIHSEAKSSEEDEKKLRGKSSKDSREEGPRKSSHKEDKAEDSREEDPRKSSHKEDKKVEEFKSKKQEAEGSRKEVKSAKEKKNLEGSPAREVLKTQPLEPSKPPNTPAAPAEKAGKETSDSVKSQFITEELPLKLATMGELLPTSSPTQLPASGMIIYPLPSGTTEAEPSGNHLNAKLARQAAYLALNLVDLRCPSELDLLLGSRVVAKYFSSLASSAHPQSPELDLNAEDNSTAQDGEAPAWTQRKLLGLSTAAAFLFPQSKHKKDSDVKLDATLVLPAEGSPEAKVQADQAAGLTPWVKTEVVNKDDGRKKGKKEEEKEKEKGEEKKTKNDQERKKDDRKKGKSEDGRNEEDRKKAKDEEEKDDDRKKAKSGKGISEDKKKERNERVASEDKKKPAVKSDDSLKRLEVDSTKKEKTEKESKSAAAPKAKKRSKSTLDFLFGTNKKESASEDGKDSAEEGMSLPSKSTEAKLRAAVVGASRAMLNAHEAQQSLTGSPSGQGTGAALDSFFTMVDQICNNYFDGQSSQITEQGTVVAVPQLKASEIETKAGDGVPLFGVSITKDSQPSQKNDKKIVTKTGNDSETEAETQAETTTATGTEAVIKTGTEAETEAEAEAEEYGVFDEEPQRFESVLSKIMSLVTTSMLPNSKHENVETKPSEEVLLESSGGKAAEGTRLDATTSWASGDRPDVKTATNSTGIDAGLPKLTFERFVRVHWRFLMVLFFLFATVTGFAIQFRGWRTKPLKNKNSKDSKLQAMLEMNWNKIRAIHKNIAAHGE